MGPARQHGATAAAAAASGGGPRPVSKAGLRWHKVSNFARSLAKMKRRLTSSVALGGKGALAAWGKSETKSSNHDRYMAKLRAGAKHGEAILRSMGFDTKVKKALTAEEESMVSGTVTTVVESEADLEKLEMWQQGDASLATEEKMRERQKLRHDRRVLEALQAFWEAAQRSLHSGGDPNANELHQEGHAIMLRRIYRVMIKNFDPVDAEKTIAEDWKNDSKGAPTLSRKRFMDAFFELADTWTAGISGHEYAAFLWMLFGTVTVSYPVTDANGNVIMMTFVWKDEAACVFDETFEEEEAEEAPPPPPAPTGMEEVTPPPTKAKRQKAEVEEEEEEEEVNYRQKAAKNVGSSQQKRAAASKVQAKVRGKKARKEKEERQQAAQKIQNISRGRLAKRTVAAVKVEREVRHREGGTPGARGQLQFWALRDGLPVKLQDVLDTLTEDDWGRFVAMPLPDRHEFILQICHKHTGIDAFHLETEVRAFVERHHGGLQKSDAEDSESLAPVKDAVPGAVAKATRADDDYGDWWPEGLEQPILGKPRPGSSRGVGAGGAIGEGDSRCEPTASSAPAAEVEASAPVESLMLTSRPLTGKRRSFLEGFTVGEGSFDPSKFELPGAGRPFKITLTWRYPDGFGLTVDSENVVTGIKTDDAPRTMRKVALGDRVIAVNDNEVTREKPVKMFTDGSIEGQQATFTLIRLATAEAVEESSAPPPATDWPMVIGRPKTPTSRPASSRPQRSRTPPRPGSSRPDSRGSSRGSTLSPPPSRGGPRPEPPPSEMPPEDHPSSKEGSTSSSRLPSRQSNRRTMHMQPRLSHETVGEGSGEVGSRVEASRPQSPPSVEFALDGNHVLLRGRSARSTRSSHTNMSAMPRRARVVVPSPMDEYWQRYETLNWTGIEVRPTTGRELRNKLLISALDYGVRDFTKVQLERIGLRHLHGDEFVQLGDGFLAVAPHVMDPSWFERHPSLQLSQPYFKLAMGSKDCDEHVERMTPRAFAIGRFDHSQREAGRFEGAHDSAGAPAADAALEGGAPELLQSSYSSGNSSGTSAVAAGGGGPRHAKMLIAAAPMHLLPRRGSPIPLEPSPPRDSLGAVPSPITQYLAFLDERRPPPPTRPSSNMTSFVAGSGDGYGGVDGSQMVTHDFSFGMSASLTSSAVLCESAVRSARTFSAAGGSWYNAIRSGASYKEDVYSREFDARAAEAIEQLTPADVANQFTTAWVTPTVGRQGRFQAVAPRGPGRRSPPPSIPTVLDPHRSQLGPAMPLMRPLPIKLPISGAGCPGIARPPRNPPSVPPSLPVPQTRSSSSPRGLGPPVPEWMQHAEDRAAWRLPGTSTETSEPRWYEPRWQQRHAESQYTTDITLYDGAVGPDGTLFRPSTKSESRAAASDSHRDHASEFTRPPSPVGSSVTTSAVWRDPLGNVYESVYERDPPRRSVGSWTGYTLIDTSYASTASATSSPDYAPATAIATGPATAPAPFGSQSVPASPPSSRVSRGGMRSPRLQLQPRRPPRSSASSERSHSQPVSPRGPRPPISSSPLPTFGDTGHGRRYPMPLNASLGLGGIGHGVVLPELPAQA